MAEKDKTIMQLALLGRPHIQIDGIPLTGQLPAKGLALLAYLGVTRQPCSREALAGLLWGETPDAAARASLRVTLNRLPPELRPFLSLSHHTAGLKLEAVEIDVAAMETAAAGDFIAWRRAVALYRGDFLEGLSLPDAPAFDEWALLERERLRLLVIDLLHRLAAGALDHQAYADGIAYARRSLTLDNWREEAHLLLMRLLALDGRRSDALAQYERCRRLLAENLGIEPATETVALYEAIKQGRFPVSPPIPQPPAPPHNLPAVTASFVGREQELEQATALLAQPDGRLLTILGPGGAGKTRLALELVARQLADPRFPDGLFFVPLASQPAGAAAAPLIAEAIGLNLSGATPPDQQLIDHLRDRRLLLVLDNFEHLLPQAGLVAGLLAAASGLRLIVTSRARLNLYEEWLLEIGGLASPPDTAGPWHTFSAPQLFIQRARRVYLGFNFAAEREAILCICRLVEGLPLALELAAAWVRTISCQEIAQAIERHLDFLTSDLDNIPARQRSLRAAFAYSWDLLSVAEQGVLARLSVFRGGFTGPAALAVAGGTLRHLSALVDKSLIQRQPDGRYRLHETIRFFAQEHIGDAGWSQVRAAHAGYYTQFLADQGGKSAGQEAEAAFQTIAAELENGRFAWQWALAGRPETEPLLEQALPPLSVFYLRRGRSLEAATWLEEALQALADGTDAPTQPLAARLQHQLAKHEEALGRYAPAGDRLQRYLPALEATASPALAADAWEMLGRVQRHLGNLADAEASFQHSLALHRLGDQPSAVAGVLNSLGVLAKNDGRYAEATAYYTESLNIFRRQGDRSGVAVCLINLGNIANVQGEYKRAQACYQESYVLAAAAENRPQMAINLLNLGSVARATGDTATAEQQYRASLALGREMGRGLIVAAALDGLGQTLLLAGDLVAARATLKEGLETAMSLNSDGMILTSLASAGRAMVQAGQVDGVRLLAAVLQQAGTAHYVKQEIVAYATEAGLDLNQPTVDLTLPAIIRLTLNRL